MIPDQEVQMCPACGRENPTSHKFCGMCGTTLDDGPRVASDPAEHDTEEQHMDHERRPEPEPFEHSITNPNELSLFRSFRPSDSTDEGYWQEETRSPYRIYFGVIIALMIVGLAYMAWRTSKAGTQNAHEVPRAPVSAEKTAAPPNAAPSPSPAAGNTTPRNAEPPANTPAAPAEKAEPTAPVQSTKIPKGPAASAPEPSRSQNAVDNGSTELAEARRYLAARDGADAQKWLWKSIAKHNGEATVLLADLYLKGDGVSKNCDQARVLLDSAARKGVAGAGERLRNLQAFGCQ